MLPVEAAIEPLVNETGPRTGEGLGVGLSSIYMGKCYEGCIHFVGNHE